MSLLYRILFALKKKEIFINLSMRFSTTLGLIFLPNLAYAGNSSASAQQSHLLLALTIIIGGAGISWIVQKIGFPAVSGEISLGMLIAALAHYQLGFWNQIITSPVITFLAEIGSILLLFEIGLESDLNQLAKVGKNGTITAITGILVPFILGAGLMGYIILASHDIKLNLFLGATLAATSTGISVRVFKDLGVLKNPAAHIVLSASIIDDILGLIILTFAVGLVEKNSLDLANIGLILLSVVAFFAFTLSFARKFMPFLIQQLLKISHDEAMVVAILISFCLFWSWLAGLIGLASIIGAFTAGLILDEISFRKSKQPYWHNRLLELSSNIEPEPIRNVIHNEIIYQHHQRRLIDLVKPLNHIFVPIFFVYAGMQIDIAAIASWHILINGLWLSLIAIASKLVSGIWLPPKFNRWLVGFGMVPRGEVGLIFALTGRQIGVFNQEIFAVILIMIIFTSLVTPLALQYIIKRGIT